MKIINYNLDQPSIFKNIVLINYFSDQSLNTSILGLVYALNHAY